jgi:hypothetical protein
MYKPRIFIRLLLLFFFTNVEGKLLIHIKEASLDQVPVDEVKDQGISSDSENIVPNAEEKVSSLAMPDSNSTLFLSR